MQQQAINRTTNILRVCPGDAKSRQTLHILDIIEHIPYLSSQFWENFPSNSYWDGSFRKKPTFTHIGKAFFSEIMATEYEGAASAILGQPCDICSAPVDRNHLNYGAKACYSCRAFFRRFHHKPKQEEEQQQQQGQGITGSNGKVLKCKNGFSDGEFCQLTPENRTFCRKCR